jgi:glycosyltransferase involved in cell wall biosynthesis
VRLLVLAYYFPPAGGAGVQRVLKWVKYLPEHGVWPEVVTVREGAYPELDPSLSAEVPEGVGVHRTLALDPFGVYGRLTGRSRAEAVSARTDDVGRAEAWPERLARALRANAFIPDARVGWVPFAVGAALRLARQEPFDAVLTSGPPHSVHLAGYAVHRLARLPWLADFRDPWTDIHYYDALPRTLPARRLDARLEGAVLRTASGVTTVSPSWADLLARKSGRPVEVVPNGFDPADFEQAGGEGSWREASASGAAAPGGEVFTLAHVGSLYDARDPRALWQALAALALPDVRVRVVGRVGEGVLASAARYGVSVEVVPYVPHAEAVAEMGAATLLVLSTEPHAGEAGHVTGKAYEYVASGRPVIGLGDPSGDAAALLAETGAGRMFARDDAAGVAGYLRELHALWQAGTPLGGADALAAAPYSRRRQAGRLADLLRTLPR